MPHMRLITALIVAHVLALSFGLAGLLIAVPNPQLWSGSEFGAEVYRFGMGYGGATHIVLAALAMLLAGIQFLGLRRTAWFLALACGVSLTAELVGTSIGFPFGDYRYTSGLGYQVLDRVPFTIPLSWFYMGLASYVLAIALVGTRPGWRGALGGVTLGAALLTIWDLALDPAMAHQELDVRFWLWEREGAYFGMPVQNFLGWMVTGFTFIGLSRLAWGPVTNVPYRLTVVSYAIYLANLIFAMTISAGVGLWWPVLITLVIGVIPATLALRSAGTYPASGSGSPGYASPTRRIALMVMTWSARLFLSRDARLRIIGGDRVPDSGPVIIVARHYHHLLDGCALLTAFDRPVYILAALDWVGSSVQRRVMELACRVAGWPVVLRASQRDSAPFRPEERLGFLRTAYAESRRILAGGGALVVFPEGYPNIDPHQSPKSAERDFLPFDPGFAAIAQRAGMDLASPVPLVPVGFDYQPGDRWAITMHVGTPVTLDEFESGNDLVEYMEDEVRRLSLPEPERHSAVIQTRPETS